MPVSFSSPRMLTALQISCSCTATSSHLFPRDANSDRLQYTMIFAVCRVSVRPKPSVRARSSAEMHVASCHEMVSLHQMALLTRAKQSSCEVPEEGGQDTMLGGEFELAYKTSVQRSMRASRMNCSQCLPGYSDVIIAHAPSPCHPSAPPKPPSLLQSLLLASPRPWQPSTRGSLC
jgi:hypothetical protein